MTQPLNYAVFGVGRIGRVHAAIVAEQGHSIVAIGDEADGAIDLTRHVLNLPFVPTFNGPQKMIETMGDSIDAVIIASHTKDHARRFGCTGVCRSRASLGASWRPTICRLAPRRSG